MHVTEGVLQADGSESEENEEVQDVYDREIMMVSPVPVNECLTSCKPPQRPQARAGAMTVKAVKENGVKKKR